MTEARQQILNVLCTACIL